MANPRKNKLTEPRNQWYIYMLIGYIFVETE